MNLDNARKIVLYVVETTEPVWSSYNVHWEDMDKVFLSRAHEQGGFENWKFISVLDKYQIASIGKVGKILDKYNGIKKYDRELAGSLDAPIYKDMKKGTYGLEGKEFYYSVKEFLSGKGRAGRSFYQLLWWMLICCNYLKNNYNGSFSYYLKKKYSEFKGITDISDEKFKNISVEEWEEFLKKSKPWEELYGVSFNVFDFIMGDVEELRFVINSYKLDSANEHFLKVTGLFDLPMDRDKVTKYLKELNLHYTLREINKGLYSYCAEGVEEYRFCYSEEKCNDCGINDICEKNL